MRDSGLVETAQAEAEAIAQPPAGDSVRNMVLLGMEIPQLAYVAESLGEQAYRGKQLFDKLVQGRKAIMDLEQVRTTLIRIRFAVMMSAA